MNSGPGPKVVMRPEAVEAVLSLARGDFACGREEARTPVAGAGRNRRAAEALVSLLLTHSTTERAMTVVGLPPEEMRAALLRLAGGEPVGHPKLSLDRVRDGVGRLEGYVRHVTTDLGWIDHAANLALRYVPWRGELHGEIWIEFTALGAELYDGGAWLLGPVVHVTLDLFHLDNEEDLVKVCAHEYNHAAVYLYRYDPSRRVGWLENCPPPVAQILDLLYLEGLARFTTQDRRYRPDIGHCFEVVQQALDAAKAGSALPRSDLWTGDAGQGHLGGTAGAFIFETILTGADQTEWGAALRGGPEGVLARYDFLASAKGLPRLRL